MTKGKAIVGKKAGFMTNGQAETFLQQIVQGETLSSAVRASGVDMPTIIYYLANDFDFSRLFAQASRVSATPLIHEGLDRSREAVDKPTTPQHVSATRNLASYVQWMASRLDPDTYGERKSGDTVVPIKFVTNLTGEGEVLADDEEAFVINLRPAAKPEAPQPAKLGPVADLREPATKGKEWSAILARERRRAYDERTGRKKANPVDTQNIRVVEEDKHHIPTNTHSPGPGGSREVNESSPRPSRTEEEDDAEIT